MKAKSPLLIVAVIIVALVAGIAIFSANQDGSKMDMSTMKQSQSGQSTDTTDAVATQSVDIKDFAYSPKTITVKVGSTVTWTNQDDVKHTVTSDDDSAETFKSELFGKGETYEHTFKQAGTFNYFCEPHPYMKATVVVTK